MSENFEINAQLRIDMGKGASRRLRHAGLVPGIVYGAHQDPVMITLGHNSLIRQLDNEAFYSHILDLSIDGKPEQVILKDLQRHPAKPFVMHADFLRVSATEALKTHVTLHFVGEDVAPGTKAGGAVSHLISDVEISCLPGDLPEYVEVDMSGLEIGDTVMLSGLVMPKGVELLALHAQGAEDKPVASMHTAHIAEEEDGEGEAEAEGGEVTAEE